MTSVHQGNALRSNAVESTVQDGLEGPERLRALATIAISLTLTLIDGSVANVALPTIAVDMNADASASIWIVNGYQLALAVCLLPFAALGEIYGYRKVYWRGLTLFTLASLACTLSTSMLALTLARVAQGIGAAGILSVNTALLRHIVPKRKLGSALGFNALVAATASTAGPSLAGGILAIASWPYLFAINLPLGGLAMILAARNLPKTECSPRRFDFISAALSMLTIGALIGTVESIGHSVSWGVIAGEVLFCGLAGGTLVVRENSALHPLFPFDLLRIPVLALSLGTSVCSFGAQMMAFVALPFLFNTGFHFGPTMVGLLMTPWPLMVAIFSPIAGRLSDRIAPGGLGAAGLATLSGGLVSLALLPATPSPLDIVWRMMMCGAGFGLFQSPNNRILVGAAPKARSGAASGMLGTARLIGQSTGTAMVALMLARWDISGVRIALFTGAILAVGGCMVSLARIRHRDWMEQVL